RDALLGGEQPLQAEHLLDDLARREVTVDAVQSAGTKDAAHRTADLGANADAAAVAVAKQDAFDSAAIGPLQKQFLRAIGSLLMASDLAGPKLPLHGQFFAELFRQVRHFAEVAGPLFK